ncbi:hypothetical protein D477_013496 [Arthrobacter crystallopoietes BAB-32]|uniref:Uncharacterized protein n=1 Tax=Arthrobacter crystallopoietes BAB-32 TaxID=1246476 RepID=N1V610_9MICC|nr:hypothetical protein [Arthrobacter crystallopoietes]EMY33683.1 hypothetical protein D477_013496 [Arthrobacter crystallopoietes BAB-32]
MPHESSMLQRFEPAEAALDASAAQEHQSAALEAEIRGLLGELEGKITRFTWLNSSAGVPQAQREENLHSLTFMQVALEDIAATVVGIAASSGAGGGTVAPEVELPSCS